MSTKTGWIKYRITGNGCSDKYKYVYAPTLCEDGTTVEDVKDYIETYLEIWLQHAYHFHSVEYDLNVFPPMRNVHNMIRSNERRIAELKKQNDELNSLFEVLID